jgi:uncharacterized protein YdhG (YjbR/CyaY superfamily)
MRKTRFATVNDYHAAFPPPVRKRLNEMRAAITKAAPEATPKISYNMPSYRGHRVLVYYAAFKEHVGFFPMASAISEFKDQLGGYEFSKGGIRFPYESPIPAGLVAKIVRFRVRRDAERAAVSAARTKQPKKGSR